MLENRTPPLTSAASFIFLESHFNPFVLAHLLVERVDLIAAGGDDGDGYGGIFAPAAAVDAELVRHDLGRVARNEVDDKVEEVILVLPDDLDGVLAREVKLGGGIVIHRWQL